ncbi:glycosyltransferase [Actinobacillus porcinus]|uniref:glycosyltransferase n=1 Tax=Actinobacillus porcinus TaxID=51048 RepID=UPI0023558169|nr:glycosyltransferase [Actinobacillus porcinus]
MILRQYVIYQEHQPQQLSAFLAQDCQAVFTPIAAVNEHSLASLPSLDLVFDTTKAQTIANRFVQAQDIAKTLSHIKCWQAVNLDENIAENDFVLIAEADIELAPNYRPALLAHIESFLSASQFELALLQRQQDNYWQDKVYPGNGEISSIVYNIPHSYNHMGAGLYLIRKRQIQKILNRLQAEKPYWLSDTFSEFCDYTLMVQTNAMLGKVRSDLSQFQKPTAPLFSVIVPIYNVERYLKQAIDSVLQQDFYNYELILVNDGSTDSSGDIAYQYNKKYPHIQFISQPNGGLSAARNTGMKLAKGDYLMFLDSDDYWRGTTILSDIAKLIEENCQPDLVLHSFSSVYSNGDIYSHAKTNETTSSLLEERFDEMVKNFVYLPNTWTKLVKRSFVEKNNLRFPDGWKFEDTPWSFQLAKTAKTYVYYHSDFYQYRRVRAGAITQGLNPNNIADFLYIFNQCYNEIVSVDKNTTLYIGLLTLLKNYVTYMVEYISYLPQEVRDRHAHDYADFEQKWMGLVGEKV